MIKNRPNQCEIGQPSDFFPENPGRIKIPLELLQRGVPSLVAIIFCVIVYLLCS